jgi:sugar lactone lactonase YvrE
VYPRELVVDANNLYWINQLPEFVPRPGELRPRGPTVIHSRSTGRDRDGAIMKMPLAGGPPVSLASAQVYPWGLAVDAQNAYWTNQGNDSEQGSVMRVSVAGGTPVALATGQPSPRAIAVDESGVYWVNTAEPRIYGISRMNAKGSELMKVPLKGGAPITLASGFGSSRGDAIAADGKNVYWANGVIWRVPNSGGERTTLALVDRQDRSPPVASLAIGGRHLYWTTGLGGQVLRVPRAGAARETFASGLNVVYKLAIDSRSVYWINMTDARHEEGCRLVKAPFNGGTWVTLAWDLTFYDSIAVDRRWVYWTDFKRGRIMKVAKEGCVRWSR